MVHVIKKKRNIEQGKRVQETYKERGKLQC